MNLYPSDVYGIPWLRPELAAESVTPPIRAWGSIRRGATHPGVWHFYTADERFSALWEREKWADVPDSGAAAACEMNWSIHDETPEAVAIERTFRKRQIAREWQQNGLRIFVDVNVPERFIGLNFAGVPKGWPAYSTRGYRARPEDLAREYAAAFERFKAGPGPVVSDSMQSPPQAPPPAFLFVVIGGGDGAREFCASHVGAMHLHYARQSEGIDMSNPCTATAGL